MLEKWFSSKSEKFAITCYVMISWAVLNGVIDFATQHYKSIIFQALCFGFWLASLLYSKQARVMQELIDVKERLIEAQKEHIEMLVKKY